MIAAFNPDDYKPEPQGEAPLAALARSMLLKYVATIDPNSAEGRCVILSLVDALDGATRIAAQYTGCFLPYEWEALEKSHTGLTDAFQLAIGYGLAAMERKARHADKPVQAAVAHARLEQEDAQSWLRKTLNVHAKSFVGLDDIFGMAKSAAVAA
jgi:hypothetical protein